jgi:hypothetical protein
MGKSDHAAHDDSFGGVDFGPDGGLRVDVMDLATDDR